MSAAPDNVIDFLQLRNNRIVQLMRRAQIPITRENYISLNWGDPLCRRQRMSETPRPARANPRLYMGSEVNGLLTPVALCRITPTPTPPDKTQTGKRDTENRERARLGNDGGGSGHIRLQIERGASPVMTGNGPHPV
jgi:hypothetical protein